MPGSAVLSTSRKRFHHVFARLTSATLAPVCLALEHSYSPTIRRPLNQSPRRTRLNVLEVCHCLHPQHRSRSPVAVEFRQAGRPSYRPRVPLVNRMLLTTLTRRGQADPANARAHPADPRASCSVHAGYLSMASSHFRMSPGRLVALVRAVKLCWCQAVEETGEIEGKAREGSQ